MEVTLLFRLDIGSHAIYIAHPDGQMHGGARLLTVPPQRNLMTRDEANNLIFW